MQLAALSLIKFWAGFGSFPSPEGKSGMNENFDLGSNLNSNKFRPLKEVGSNWNFYLIESLNFIRTNLDICAQAAVHSDRLF